MFEIGLGGKRTTKKVKIPDDVLLDIDVPAYVNRKLEERKQQESSSHFVPQKWENEMTTWIGITQEQKWDIYAIIG